MEHLLETYGYPILFVGTFLEGETPLLMASFLAHRGYFALPAVVLIAFAGTFSADQFFFHLGHTRGRRYLEKRPTWQSNAARANALLARYGILLVLGFRFFYGLRIATPFVLGMSGFGRARFLLLDAIAAAFWCGIVSTLGYSLGGLLALFLRDLRHYELLVLVAIGLVSILVWLFFRRRRAIRADHAA